jgi:hypothetical protein
MEQIRQRRVLHDVLLQVLADHTEGLPIHQVYDLVDAQYRFRGVVPSDPERPRL